MPAATAALINLRFSPINRPSAATRLLGDAKSTMMRVLSRHIFLLERRLLRGAWRRNSRLLMEIGAPPPAP